MTDALSILQFYEGGVSILVSDTRSSLQREVAGQLFTNALRARKRRATDMFETYGFCPEYADNNSEAIRCILETIVEFCDKSAVTN